MSEIGVLLSALTLATGVPVRMVPDGVGTAASPQGVFLEARYALLLERDGELLTGRLAVRKRRRAEAVYVLLHELCHATVQEGDEYRYPDSEIEANVYASAHFISFLTRNGMSEKRAIDLFDALPDYWRHPGP